MIPNRNLMLPAFGIQHKASFQIGWTFPSNVTSGPGLGYIKGDTAPWSRVGWDPPHHQPVEISARSWDALVVIRLDRYTLDHLLSPPWHTSKILLVLFVGLHK